jgi:hypothetical protein
MPENLPVPAHPLIQAELDREQAAVELRDAGGMFVPGKSGNPAGRPKGSKNQLVELNRQLELAVRENINPKAVRKLIERIMEMALAGDMKAAKLLLDKVLANASSGGDEQMEPINQFVFQVKNLTLKPADLSQPTGVVIDVTPQENAVSTGASQNNQARPDQSGGGQLVGKAPSAPVAKVPDFMGKAGQSDNQSTNRGTGGK